VAEDAVDLVWVPGAFELPLVAKIGSIEKVRRGHLPGAVIRGDTDHYDTSVSLPRGHPASEPDDGVPILFAFLRVIPTSKPRPRRRNAATKRRCGGGD